MRGAADADAHDPEKLTDFSDKDHAQTQETIAAGRRRRLLDLVLTLVGLVLAWQLASLVLGAHALPAPWRTLVRLQAIVGDGDFTAHAWETLRAFLSALGIALLGGLALGVVLGAHRLSGDVAEPVLVALYSIPKITLYPVILLLFGLGVSAKIAFGVIHGIIPVVIFTTNAVRNIPKVYLRAAAAMQLRPLQTATTVIMPAALPEIVSGFRVGFALTLLGVLIGEMFASQRGLGYMLIKAMETNDVDTVMALALMLVVLAAGASAVLLALDRRLHRRAATDPGV
jgi:NitT/TauT family transport system permease protein